MEPSKEAIGVRLSKLNGQFLGRVNFGGAASSGGSSLKKTLNREGLFDALTVLYDECNNESLKKGDQHIQKFVERYRSVLSELRQMRVNISDFEVKEIIGRGHFAEVHVVKEKHTGDVYAMKTLRKEATLRQKDIAFFEEERDVMAAASSPWVTSLQYAFQDATQLYLVMEYCPGGDLAGMMERRGTLGESVAAFYLAELLQALTALHDLGYVHRDLKPDNVLLDRCGHLKLADFGSAGRLSSGSVSSAVPVGTPDYIAPELLQTLENSKPVVHGPACDFWSLGVIAFELIIGHTPFATAGSTPIAVYSAITLYARCPGALRYPPQRPISDEYRALVGALLNPAPHKRLQGQDAQRHLVFKDIKWSSLRQQAPPVVPVVSAQDDTSNFSQPAKQRPQPSVDSLRTRSQFSGRNLPFIGFTYVQDAPMLAGGCGGDSTASSDPGSGSSANNGFLNASLNSTAICLSNAREMEALLESRKCEIQALHKKLATSEAKRLQDRDKDKRLQAAEQEREQMEKDLAHLGALNQQLRYQLKTEHEERKMLETKSLELIRSAKHDWRMRSDKRKAELLGEAAAMRGSHAAVQDAAQAAHDRAQLLQTQLDQANVELQAMQKLHKSHKDSMAKVRKLSRQSIVDVEQMRADSGAQLQSQASELQQERGRLQAQQDTNRSLLLELAECRKDYEAQLEAQVSLSTDLEFKVLELEGQNKLLQEQGSQRRAEGRDRSLGLQAALGRERTAVGALQAQIEDLEFSVCSLESDLIEKNALMAEVEKQRDSFKGRLDSAVAREDSYRQKVTTLEDLLGKLQQEVTRLENVQSKEVTRVIQVPSQIPDAGESVAHKERLLVLQEQQTKLEEQLTAAREEVVLLKQEARKASSVLWKKEKEFTDCDLDRRIATRELKQAEERVKACDEEKKKLAADHETALSNARQALLAAKKDASEAAKRLTAGTEEVAASKEQSKHWENKANDEEAQRQRVIAELDRWKNDVHRLKAELQYSENRRLKSEAMVERSLQEAMLSEAGHCEQRELRARMEVYLQERERHCDSLAANYKMLQEACVILEEQLLDFERLTEAQDVAAQQNKQEIASLRASVSQLTTEALQQRSLYDSQCRSTAAVELKYAEALEQLSEERARTAQLEKELEDLMGRESSASSDAGSARDEASRLRTELQQAKAQIRAGRSEVAALKEETSRLLTDGADLREEALRAQLALRESQETIATLRSLAAEKDEELVAEQTHWQQRELKAQATIAQQTKLIDFLQSKVEEATKRKKTFGDMLFGKTSTKENTQPPGTPLTSQLPGPEQQRALAKEKQTTRELREELAILKNKLAALQNKADLPGDTVPHCKDEIMTTPRRPEPAGGATQSQRVGINSKSLADITMEGWVRIQKGAGLERVYMKLCGARLEWRAQDAAARGELLLAGRPRLLPGAPPSHALPADQAHKAFMIDISSGTSCWPSQCLVVLCPSEAQKEDWLAELQRVRGVQLVQELEEPQMPGAELLRLSKPQPLCLMELQEGLFLIGTETEMLSYEHGREGGCSVVFGCNGVRRARSSAAHCALLDSNGHLSVCGRAPLLAALKSCQGAELTTSYLPMGTGQPPCLTFEMSTPAVSSERVLLCAGTASHLLVFVLDVAQDTFLQVRRLASEPVACLRLTPHSLLVGSHKFHELDLADYRVEEFLDPSDTSLSHVVYAHKKKIFPTEVVKIKESGVDRATEYLLCYNDFGVFVDEFGQRSRSEDIKWSHVPLDVIYKKPFLFVVHFAGIEVSHLKETSYKKCVGDDVSVSSASTEAGGAPERIMIEFNAPKFLGKSLKKGCVFVASSLSQKSADGNSHVRITELDGNIIFKRDLGVSIETLDSVDDSDSCRSVKIEEVDTSIEVTTEFASSIKNKAKLLGSIKKENRKVNNIRSALSGCEKFKKPAPLPIVSCDSDSSDSELSSSYGEDRTAPEYRAKSYREYRQAHSHQPSKDSSDGSAKKQVRFNSQRFNSK